MSINTIIVNTTTGADAATSINAVIDLVNAGGFAGATGLTGATGAGLTGATGIEGATGLIGATGAGLTGATGSAGADGATGLEGATGLIGATGAAQVGGATLGANEFTGDQLINGTSKQIFAASVDPNEFTNIAKVTGAVQGGVNIDEINFAFTPTIANSIISNSWLLEAYTDNTFTRGAEMSLGFDRGRMQVLNSIGSQAVVAVVNNPNNLTAFAAFADNMLIGANAAQTRTAITVGHNALPNLNLRGTLINSFGTLNHTGNLNVNGPLNISNAAGTSTTSGTINHTGGFTVNSDSTNISLTAPQFNVTAPNSNMSGNLNVNQAVDATINTRRLHFANNPFNADPPINLGAIRLFPDNKTLNYTVYDNSGNINDQSYMQQYVDTATTTSTTTIGAEYNGFNGFLRLQNVNGVATLETNVNTTIGGNLTVTGTFSAPSQLPAGAITEAATFAVDFATLTGTFQTVSRTTTDTIALTVTNREPGRFIKILVTNNSGADRTMSYSGLSIAAADPGRRPATLANGARYLFDLFCVSTGQPLLLNTSGIV